MLSTEDPPPTEDGIQHTWENTVLEAYPVDYGVASATKVQVDVLNAGPDVMSL